MLVKVQKKNNSLIVIIEQLIHVVINYMKRTKHQTSQLEILNVIDKLTTKVVRNYDIIKENIIVIRNIITKLFFIFFFLFFFKLDARNYFFIVVISIKLTKSTLNKKTKIVIRLNNNDVKQSLKKNDSRVIQKLINEKIAKFEITIKNIKVMSKFEFLNSIKTS